MHRTILLIVAIWLSAAPASAGELAAITEHNPPFNYMADGHATGIAVDMLLALSEQAGLGIARHDITFWPWARAYKETLKKKDVILFSAARTPQRERAFIWIGPILTAKSCLYGRKGTTPDLFDVVTAARKHRFGTLRDSGSEQFLIAMGIPSHLLQRVHDQRLNIKKLMDGRIDVMAALEPNFRHIIRHMGLSDHAFTRDRVLIETDLYFAVNKDTDPNLVSRMQQAMAELRTRGKVDTIIKQYIH